MVVPPVVSAVTLYFLLTSISGVTSFFGYDTWLGVAMAHSVMTVPFATVLILVSLSQLDRRIGQRLVHRGRLQHGQVRAQVGLDTRHGVGMGRRHLRLLNQRPGTQAVGQPRPRQARLEAPILAPLVAQGLEVQRLGLLTVHRGTPGGERSRASP